MIDNNELLLICFIFLIILIYVISCTKEAAIIIASFTALIIYLLNMRKRDGFCINDNNGSKQEEDALRLLGNDFKESYVDYDQNLLTDYASEPYMVSPSQAELEPLKQSSAEFNHKLKNNTLTYDDLDLDYPGAVEIDQIESSDYTWMGHVDAQEQKIGYKMPGDVTFDLNRTKGNDDLPTEWSSSAVLDGDEQMANNRRARALNTNVRAAMGTIRKKEFMDRFVTDELNEFGEKIWWGRADY